MQPTAPPRSRPRLILWTALALAMTVIGTKPLPAADGPVAFGELGHGAKVVAMKGDSGQWGLAITGGGQASATQLQPVQLEFWSPTGELTTQAAGYSSLERTERGVLGRATVTGPNQSRFAVEDRWGCQNGSLRLSRTVTVAGTGPGGFLSGFKFDLARTGSWSDVEWFAPGMIYGGFEHLTEAAIGGRAHYRPGAFAVRIREDRLPAPLVAARFPDGSSLAVLNPTPRGDTTTADSHDTQAVPLVDERFRFGAVGAEEHRGGHSLGYWFPGSEGEVTYAGNTYPGGQLHAWRRRFHPIQAGLRQSYEIAFRLGREASFPACYAAAWRWAWQTLDPAVTPQDIAAARRSLVDVLAKNIIQQDGRTGIPNYIDAMVKVALPHERNSVLGFTGKSLETAACLLQEAALDSSPRGAELRRKGEALVASFLKLKLAPPAGEGFAIDTGLPVRAIPAHGQVYLRSFGDDLKALLKAYQRELRLGRAHPDWLAWCREFADWLLTQQQPGGGFPRSWKPGTGEVVSASPNSSFNAIPLLVLMQQITGERKYLDAAQRAAECCWANGQSRGRFVGGTIDNPDVLDKEAATLSLEAYLLLHAATRDPRWLTRAQAAADYAETWVYLWNVPMPADEDNSQLHWKRGVPTTGLQLISTGHSLVDAYMAFDADEFAELGQLAGDAHYLEVARLLLHNTKNLLAVPGRTFDLGEPGWQQEHWSLAPRRGYGLHRGWLPWVATSQLNGIFGLMELNPAVFAELAAPPQIPSAQLPPRTIKVDGDAADWQGIEAHSVTRETQLWFGQGMTREKWRGPRDLSYQWRGAWSGNRLYFLFEVTDDKVVAGGQASSYLCDCVEVYLDPGGRGGARVEVLDGRADWFERCDPRELRGYELHFLPTSPPRVYLDHRDKYAFDKPHTSEFVRDWQGEVAMRRTETGYVLELGFTVPNLRLEPERSLGVEIGVCDDDGDGRKSILMWTGTKKSFWLTMNDYGRAQLTPQKK